MSLLKITAIGNLGKDPELRYTTDGKPICSFSMACSEKKKDRDGNLNEITTWIKVSFFGNLATVASQWLQKGKPVYIEGKGRLDTYTDRDGKERTSLEVFGTEIQLIAPRDDSSGPRSAAPANSPRARAEAAASSTAKGLTLDDDIPF